MGQCYGKTVVNGDDRGGQAVEYPQSPLPVAGNGAASGQPVMKTPARSSSTSPWPSPFPQSSAAASPLPAGVSPSPARTSTPRRFFRRPFPPPSPAKHIKASIRKRLGTAKPKDGPIPEEATAPEQLPDKSFGYGKNFGAKYELGREVGRGHFGHTCFARGKKGELKDQPVAVKIISKAKVRNYYFLWHLKSN